MSSIGLRIIGPSSKFRLENPVNPVYEPVFNQLILSIGPIFVL